MSNDSDRKEDERFQDHCRACKKNGLRLLSLLIHSHTLCAGMHLFHTESNVTFNVHIMPNPSK